MHHSVVSYVLQCVLQCVLQYVLQRVCSYTPSEFTFTCACTRAYTHTSTHVRAHTHIHTCVHAYTHTHTHIHTDTHTHTYIRIHAHTHAQFVNMCGLTCVAQKPHKHTHTHTHTNTHTHTHTHTHCPNACGLTCAALTSLNQEILKSHSLLYKRTRELSFEKFHRLTINSVLTLLNFEYIVVQGNFSIFLNRYR